MKLIHWLQAIWFISTVVAWWQIFLVRRQLKMLRKQNIRMHELTAMLHQLKERYNKMFFDLKLRGESERR